MLYTYALTILFNMTTALTQYFIEHFRAAPSEIEQLVAAFQYKTVRKNEHLVLSGAVCRYTFFVGQGAIRSYFINEKGQESTRYIALENQFITTVHSFIAQTPTNEFIQALEPTHLYAISYTDFKQLIATTTLARDLYIKQLEVAYMTSHWRLEGFLKMTAKQRYRFLLDTHPALIQRLSNKIVASYLGITQESLSRLKSLQ